jgi:WD40 repeat protein
LNELIHDAYRFVQLFASSIEDHPLLIYLSALPFTPVDTLLFKTFAAHSIPWVFDGYHKSWPPLLQILSGHERRVQDVAFSPDGTRTASGSFDLTVRVWDVSSGVLLLAPLQGHTGHIFSVAYSSDGQQIASGSGDSTVRIWDAISGVPLFPALTGHTDNVLAVAFSLDGSRVASGSTDETIRVWDATTGSDVFGALRGHEGGVRCVAFTPDGQRLLSGASDNTICGWDLSTGMMTLVLQGHNDAVGTISLSSDGNCIASGSDDGTIRLWDVDTGKEHRVLRAPDGRGIYSVYFLPGDTRIVSFDGEIRVWDAVVGAQVSTSAIAQVSHCMKVSPAGDRFAFACAEVVMVWDASILDDTISTNEDQTDISALSFSPDGQLFASISKNDCSIHLWHAETGQEACLPLQSHQDSVESVAFSPDSRLVASGSADTTIIVWDVMSGKEVLALWGHEEGVVSVAFSYDGMQILSGSSDDTVRLWSLKTGSEARRPMRGHVEIESVAFHPDGERAISGCLQGTICIWNLGLGMQIFRERLVPLPNILKSVRFSPNGRHLMITCALVEEGQAPLTMTFDIPSVRESEMIMPIHINPDGWIHDFKTDSVIGKLPAVISIPLYASSLSTIVFKTRDPQSRIRIMHFPPSEFTMPGTSNLALNYGQAEETHTECRDPNPAENIVLRTLKRKRDGDTVDYCLSCASSHQYLEPRISKI